MNRDYPLSETPDPGPRKNIIPVKRAYEVADSLEQVGYAAQRAGYRLKEKAKSDIDKKSAEYLISSARKDLSNSERYRSLADKASKK